ncbi:MAG: hypothetical protein LUD72_09680 [Bacteroidales bacterium]|nr:hypothetical protein [Bacteroidales bacterium]
MKRNIITFIAGAAVLFAVNSCSIDELMPEIEPIIPTDVFTPKGEPVEAYLNLSVAGLTISVGTRADGDEVEDTDGERAITDFWLFQYDVSQSDNEANQSMIAIPQYFTVSDQSELTEIPVTLSDNDGDESVLYVVTNTGSSTWVQYDSSTQRYEGFMTVAEIKVAAIPSVRPQRIKYDYDAEEYEPYSDEGELSIPMSGCTEAVTVTKGITVEVAVQRMYAKLCVQIDLSDFNDEVGSANIYDVMVGNIPMYSTVGTLLTGDGTAAGDYSGCEQWVTRAFTNNQPEDDDQNGDIYPYVIYVPENIQGVNGSNADKAQNVPEVSEGVTRALYVTVGVTTISSDGVRTGPYTFTAYPGEDETTNFNVRRNCVYKVRLGIHDLVDDDPIPSANCIVCLSGQTTAFYPYCRTEVGGGHYITDFLDSSYGNDFDGSKRIESVTILWQSVKQSEVKDLPATGFIGDNTEGNLVWIDPAPDESLSDETKSHDEYRRKIYVKIPEGEVGNAVVAAYNSFGDIVWSWHIWSRLPADDPSNEGNGVLYYTYDWDENGIKYDQTRIAGRTVMNCNLGALENDLANPDDVSADDPNIFATFGTVYQWGRKDPFQRLRRTLGTGSYSYASSHEKCYRNDGTTQCTVNGDYDTSYDFYSVPANRHEEVIGSLESDVFLQYAVSHPTAFICGTYEADVRSNKYTGGSFDLSAAALANYPYNGNWIPNDENGKDDEEKYHYGLWGGLQYTDDMKVYVTGYTDAAGEAVDIWDNYGEKSIFDPCPYGWEVSPPDLWLGFTKTGLNAHEQANYLRDVNYKVKGDEGFYLYMDGWGRDGGDGRAVSFFPTQGTRAPDGCVYQVGVCGNYHNATADLNRVNILHIHNEEHLFNIFENEILQYYAKATAGPVRCVRVGSVSN